MSHQVKIATAITGVALFVAVLFIHCQKSYSVVTARVMVQSYALSGNGIIQTGAMDLDGEQRNLPVDWTIRLTSAASVRAALIYQKQDADSEVVEGIRKNLYARLVPGSTVIEINLFGADENHLTNFLDSLLAVQEQLWNTPERAQAEAILQELSQRKIQLQTQITQSAAEVARMQSELAIGSEEKLAKLDSASIQLNLEELKIRAESAAIEKELIRESSQTSPVLLSGEQRLEVMRMRSAIDDGEVQLAALESRGGPNYRGVIELKNRLAELRNKQKAYVGFESDRLKSIARILGTSGSDLQLKTDEITQRVLSDRRQQTTSDYMIALADLESSQNQIKWVAQEQDRVSLYYKSIIPPLVVLDHPGVRDGFQKKMKTAQYSIAIIGSIFLWFSCTTLADAKNGIRAIWIGQKT
jgi:hypothetical protein